MNILSIVAIPFLGTALGAATVLLTRQSVSQRLHNSLLGFAAGVMVAAAIWSLITPAIELSLHLGNMKWMPPAVGILLGMLFLLMLDSLVPHMHPTGDSVEGPQSKLGRRPMLMLAVTLHNIPEGIAVAIPIYYATQKRGKAVRFATLSGLAEPLGGLLGYIVLRSVLTPSLLACVLAVVAGIMVYISLDELLPTAENYGEHHIAIIGVISGMVFMSFGLLLF